MSVSHEVCWVWALTIEPSYVASEVLTPSCQTVCDVVNFQPYTAWVLCLRHLLSSQGFVRRRTLYHCIESSCRIIIWLYCSDVISHTLFVWICQMSIKHVTLNLRQLFTFLEAVNKFQVETRMYQALFYLCRMHLRKVYENILVYLLVLIQIS